MKYIRPWLIAVAVSGFGSGIMEATVNADSLDALRRAPRLIAAAPQLPRAEKIAELKVLTYTGWTRRLLHMPDRRTVAAFSWGQPEGNWVFLIDTRDLSVKRHDIPDNTQAGHCAALGKDGNLWFAPFVNGRMYRFDPTTGKHTAYQTPLDNEQQAWDAWGGSNGKIYFGTYPTGSFAEFDPATGQCRVWPRAAADQKYIHGFAEDDHGRILFRATHPGDEAMRFDPKTDRFEKIEPWSDPLRGSPDSLPKPPDGDESFRYFIGHDGRQFALAFPTGRLCEILPQNRLRIVGDQACPAEHWLLSAADGVVIGMSYHGVVFRYDLARDDFLVARLPNTTTHGSELAYLETITPDCVIAHPGIHLGFAGIHPETGEVSPIYDLFSARAVQGQCAVGHGGKAYIGMYGHAALLEYDPSKPYAWTKNPRVLMVLEDAHNQTRPRAALTDGRIVWFSTDGSYSMLGGALAAIDPQTGKIDVYRDVIKNQNMPTIVYQPSTKLIWGGTWRWGTSKSHDPDPALPSSHVYAFDTEYRKRVRMMVVWENSDETAVLGVSEKGILLASSGDEIALIDTGTERVLFKGPSPIAVPAVMRRGHDGLHYGLSQGKLIRWDIDAGEIAVMAETPNCTTLTEPRRDTWIMGGAEGVFRARLNPAPRQ